MNYDFIKELRESGIDIDLLNSEFPDGRFLNTYAVAGLVLVLKNGKVEYILCERKTKGYPNANIIGKLSFIGGNTKRDENGLIPFSPREVFMGELDEEISSFKIKDKDIGSDFKCILGKKITPFADYFLMVPPEAVGNINILGHYCCIVSIYISEIDETDLRSLLGIGCDDDLLVHTNLFLKRYSLEAEKVLISISSLKMGMHDLFGWGYDIILADILPLLRDSKFRLNVENKGKRTYAIKLSTYPDLPFKEREFSIKDFIRIDNNPYLSSATDEQVFEPRKRSN